MSSALRVSVLSFQTVGGAALTDIRFGKITIANFLNGYELCTGAISPEDAD